MEQSTTISSFNRQTPVDRTPVELTNGGGLQGHNIDRLQAIVYRHGWAGLLAFASVIGGALVYLALAPRFYQAQVQMHFNETSSTSVSNLGRDIAQQPGGEAKSLATQQELIRSKRILEQAYQIYQQEADGKEEAVISLGQIRPYLKVKTVPGTQIIQLLFENEYPKDAALLANLIAKTTIQDNVDTIRSKARSARQFLEVQLPQKREKLIQVEKTIGKFKGAYGLISIIDSEGRASLDTQQLSQTLASLQGEARSLTIQLQEVQTRNSNLRAITNANTTQDTYVAVRSGQDSQLQTLREKLTDLEAQISSLRSTVTENHPTLIQLQQERDEVRALYAQQLAKFGGDGTGLDNPESIASDQVSQDLSTRLIQGEIEASALTQKLVAVRNALAQVESRRRQFPVLEQIFSKLSRQREAAASSLQLLERKLDEARIAEAQVVSNLRIVEWADSPRTPSSPKTVVVMVLAIAAGIVMAVVTIVLRELFDRKVHNITQISELVRLPVLSVLPTLPAAEEDLLRPELFFKDAALVEAYRALLKSIEFRFMGDLKVLVVSSTISGEGKSIVSAHLAAVAAMLSRRTLIIDADLRRPTQHQRFNLGAQPGITDVILGDVSLADAVKPTGIGNLSAITAGSSHIYPSRFFESEGMDIVLRQAAASYDLVIVDTPPVTGCVDALTLCHKGNQLLLVARPELTEKTLLQQSVAELTDNGIGILGVAVNGSNLEIDHYYRHKFKYYQSA